MPNLPSVGGKQKDKKGGRVHLTRENQLLRWGRSHFKKVPV